MRELQELKFGVSVTKIEDYYRVSVSGDVGTDKELVTVVDVMDEVPKCIAQTVWDVLRATDHK